MTIPKPKIITRSVKRKLHVVRNTLATSFFPLGIVSVVGINTLFIAIVLNADPSSWWRSGLIATLLWESAIRLPFFLSLPSQIQLVLLSITAGLATCLAAMIFQRYLLRALLSWHGWIYTPRGSKPWSVVLWMGAVKILTSAAEHALTFSYQGSLPRLPVPSLEETTTKYLDSIRPLRTEAEFAQDRAHVESFMANEGPKLQRYLWLKSIWAANYVTDWWEQYVYLRGRSPLMINSNYYINDSSVYRATTNWCARAGDLVEGMLQYMRMIDRETLPVQMAQNAIPLCMNQSRRVFGTTRVPGLETDTLVHLEAAESRHIVVRYRGLYIALPVYYKSHLLDGYQIQNQFELLISECDAYLDTHGESGWDGKIGALTAGNRTRWAEAREEHFGSGINEASLTTIERALFVVILDPAEPETDTEMGRLNLMGRGYDRWFDKSVTLILYRNGVMGINCEHSYADALCTGHMVEWAMTRHFSTEVYDDDGNVLPSSSFTKKLSFQGTILPWALSPQAEVAIETAVISAHAAIDDLALEVYHHPWGKDRIKACKLSPDGFIQMAMQLAYYRDQGSLCLTYEASTTRMFRNGRTETVRTCSPQVKDFVLAMSDPSASVQDKLAALQAAVDVHVLKFKDAMAGRGIDRHLFALYVVSVGRSIESTFLSEGISQPWMLSTSQQPQHQTDNWDPIKNPEHARRVSSGGGFGPVADGGYGVSYMVAGRSRLYFHVSSKVSAPATDSSRFVSAIAQALDDMAELVERSDA